MKKYILSIVLLIFAAAGAWAAQETWYCPMHPHYTSDMPGNCPICGMKLVKKKAEAPSSQVGGGISGHAQVSLTPGQVQLIGVRTMPVSAQPLVKTVRAAGYVSTNHELYEYQNEYIQAYVEYARVYRDYKRYAHVRNNREIYRDLQTKLHAAEEKLLKLGLGTMQMEQMQKVSWKTPWDQPELLFFKEGVNYWVVAQVFESDRGFVEVGQEVQIEVPAYFEKTRGVIRSIGGIFDPDTRTVNALIEIKDYRGELDGNMSVNVTIPVELGELLMVPKSAVMDTGSRKIVYVQVKSGIFEPREIEVSAHGDNGWSVKSGLKQGEQVVVDGNFLIDSESRIQAPIGGASHD